MCRFPRVPEWLRTVICFFVIYVVGLVSFTLILGLLSRARSQDRPWSRAEALVGRHCLSESQDPDDCRVIATIVLRQASERGLDIPGLYAVRYTRHPRSPSRPYLGEIDETLREPPSWARLVPGCPWDSCGRAYVELRFSVARGVLDGRLGHRCDGTPITWGSPTYDRETLDAWYARGYDRLTCGNGTQNEIVGRKRR